MLSESHKVDLSKYLSEAVSGGYIDLRYQRESSWQLALREESFENIRGVEEFITCRAAQHGYGVASSTKVDEGSIKSIIALAQKLSRLQKESVNLAPVDIEYGRRRHLCAKVFEEDEAATLLTQIRSELKEKLGSSYARSEIVISHSIIRSHLVTCEGTDVYEEVPLTDIVIYLASRGFRTGYASSIVGGLGGFEVFASKDWGKIIEELAVRAVNQLQTTLLPPLLRGRHLKVVLNEEAAGALAHEVAHLLESRAWVNKMMGLDIAEDVKVVDDPTLPTGYGSFAWDCEGVSGRRKVLLSRDEVKGLHTRLTTSDGREAGNARGERTLPTPSMSNIFFASSDWRFDEMIQDMRSGIYAEGVVRADIDLSDGTFELIPEIAYLVEDKELKKPIRWLRLRGELTTILKRIDAVGRVVRLRPNFEKGSRISEGGPFIRVNGLQCG
ncbi:MAG: TldD/PmbA family protein [Nitrososphaerales archaeon]